MSLEKRIGLGQTLSVDGTALSCAIIDGWSGPDTSADDVETTVLCDNYKTFQRGQIDPGTAQFVIAYDPNDTASQALAALYASGDVATWTITYSDEGSGTATESFDGYINGLSREISKGSLVQCTVSIKVSDDPGYTTSSS